MPKPGPKAVAEEIIHRFSVVAVPRPLVEVIVEIAVEQGWFDSNDLAAELTNGWVKHVERHLQNELLAAHKYGRPVKFSFNSVSDYMIQGNAHPESSDPPEVVEAKRLRSGAYEYSESLVALTPAQFEAVCRGILGILGCAEPHLSAFSADQGIDFYGRLHLQGRLGNAHLLGSIDRAISMWVVGQAKHYALTQVATPHLRELVGSVELAKTKTFAGRGHGLDQLGISALDPVLFLFITTGRISGDAWTLIDRSGMVAMDGETVAVFLAENGVGLSAGSFDEATFLAWVTGHSV